MPGRLGRPLRCLALQPSRSLDRLIPCPRLLRTRRGIRSIALPLLFGVTFVGVYRLAVAVLPLEVRSGFLLSAGVAFDSGAVVAGSLLLTSLALAVGLLTCVLADTGEFELLSRLALQPQRPDLAGIGSGNHLVGKSIRKVAYEIVDQITACAGDRLPLDRP
ncbi:hypothetical protein [Nocardia flavorosea]|uniref:hypothetical protein n=1 Tax=Nocardia flavorosea TaxID=53429 RepID=UPI0024567F9B|nr:hypothetical protein [Nocardia flavorosea]